MRGFSITEYERLKKVVVEQERKILAMESNREAELNEAVVRTEIEVRRAIVGEMRERRLNGEREDDEVMRLVEKMNESSRLMEKEMRDREAARNKEYEERIDELKRQKDDVEADNIRLSRIIAALKGESRVVGVMRRIRRHAGVRPNGAGRERTGVEGGAGAAERGDQRAALRAGGGAEERGRRDGEAEGGDEPRGEGEAGAARREGLRAEGERGAASAERAAAERQGPTGEGARGAASAERAAAGEAEDAGGHDERDD